MRLMSRQEAIEYYSRSRGAADGGERREDLRQTVYRLLGLVPERTEVARQDVDYLGTLITGFYSAEFDTMYLLDDQGGPLSASGQATLVHELTHALQDQHHDLNKLHATQDVTWDAARALASVLEGDAMHTEAAFFGRPGRPIPECFTLPPPSAGYAIKRDLDSWYFDGYCFVKTALELQAGGIGAIFARLPATTEQLLHPEKYVANEPADRPRLPDLVPTLPGGWSRLGGNVFGEYVLQNLLMLGMPEDRPRVQAAAAGWGGDAFSVYGGPDGARLLHASLRWDAPGEAAEFFEALAASLRSRAPDTTLARGTSIESDIEGKVWQAELVGDTITLLVATDRPAVEAAASSLSLR